MSDVETRFLPLLPLSTGVVLPQMVVPLGLESDDAKAAADRAEAIAEKTMNRAPRRGGRRRMYHHHVHHHYHHAAAPAAAPEAAPPAAGGGAPEAAPPAGGGQPARR